MKIIRKRPRKTNEGFVRGTMKTYGLMELARGKSTWVEMSPDDTVMSWPHLVYRLLLLFIAVMIVMMAVSMAFDAPLKEIANPTFPENPAKAPWYFLGLQELVSYSALTGGVLIPGLVVVGLMLIPYIDRETEGVGIWFHSKRGKMIALGSAIVIIIVVSGLLAATIYLETNHGGVRGIIPGMPMIFYDFANAGSVMVGFMALSFFVVGYATNSIREGAISLFTMFIVAFFVLTIVGVYLRGPNWLFYWFWEEWPVH